MHRTICCKLWTDEKVKKLKPLEKLLFVYLITNPHTHLSGLYYLPQALAEAELGIKINWESVKSLAAYDAENQHVWVYRMYGYQGRGPMVKQCVIKHLADLHVSKLVTSFCQHYGFIDVLEKITHLDRVSNTLSNTLAYPYPTPTPVSDPDSESKIKQEKSEEVVTQILLPAISSPLLTAEEIRLKWNAIEGVKLCKKLAGDLLTRIKKLSKQYPSIWWESLFEEIKHSKFLTGHAQPKPGHKIFRVDLEWATGPINLGKILSGKYDDQKTDGRPPLPPGGSYFT